MQILLSIVKTFEKRRIRALNKLNDLPVKRARDEIVRERILAGSWKRASDLRSQEENLKKCQYATKKDLDATIDNLVEEIVSLSSRVQVTNSALLVVLFVVCSCICDRTPTRPSAPPLRKKRIKSLPVVAAKSSGSQTEEAVLKIQI